MIFMAAILEFAEILYQVYANLVVVSVMRTYLNRIDSTQLVSFTFKREYDNLLL